MWYGKYESLEDFDDMYAPPFSGGRWPSYVPPHEHPKPYPPFELPLREEVFDDVIEGILANPLVVNPVAQAEKERIDKERAARVPSNYGPKKIINGRHRTDPANWPVIRTENGDASVPPSYIIAQKEAGTPCDIVSRGKWPGDLDTYEKFLKEFQNEPAGKLEEIEPATELRPVEDMPRKAVPLGWVRRLLGLP